MSEIWPMSAIEHHQPCVAATGFPRRALAAEHAGFEENIECAVVRVSTSVKSIDRTQRFNPQRLAQSWSGRLHF
jgi:hypothetical protein